MVASRSFFVFIRDVSVDAFRGAEIYLQIADPTIRCRVISQNFRCLPEPCPLVAKLPRVPRVNGK